MATPVDTTRMTPFELEQWLEIQKWSKPTERVTRALPSRVQGLIDRGSDLASTARTRAQEVPGADLVARTFADSLGALVDTLTKASDASVRRESVIKVFVKRGHEVKELEDIRDLDLRAVMKVMPRLDLAYVGAATAEGAAAGFVMSGGAVAAAGGAVAGGVGALPGASTLVATMAADAAAVLGASSRVVAHTAAYYGYDTSLPNEQLFASAVLGTAMTNGDGASKQAACLAVNRLMGDLARRKTWEQLNKNVVTQLVRAVYKTLGLRLTQRKLAQAVPVVGVLAGAGMNARILGRVADTAEHLYRQRFLQEKYGVASSDDVADVTDDERLMVQVEQDLAEVLDGQLLRDET